MNTKAASSSGTLAGLVVHVLSLQSRSALIWGASLGLYAAALVASFTAFDPVQMDRMMQAYPEGMLEAFGITDMASPEGFLAGQVLTSLPWR